MSIKRRILRNVINGVTLLSVVMISVVVSVWVRSYFVHDGFDWETTHDEVHSREWRAGSLAWGRGQVRFDYGYVLTTGFRDNRSGLSHTHKHRADPPYPAYMQIDESPADFDHFGIVFDLHDFVYAPSKDEKETRFNWFLGVPLWVLLVSLLILPLAQCVLFIAKRRHGRENRCRHCGYDLRATPQRCPECGAVAIPELL